MMALLFLIGAFLLGTGLVRRATARLLSHAEQVMWGLVAGWMLCTLAAYLVARGLGRLSLWPMVVLTALIWLVAFALWFSTVKLLLARKDLEARTLWRADYAGLLLVLLLFAPFFLRLFSTRMLHLGDAGVYSGGSTWYDMGWHTAITTAFLYGQNFPPVYTPFPPETLLYPFLPDFLTALLMCLGWEMRTALLASAIPLALAATGLFYALARRILDANAFQTHHTPALYEKTKTASHDDAGKTPDAAATDQRHAKTKAETNAAAYSETGAPTYSEKGAATYSEMGAATYSNMSAATYSETDAATAAVADDGTRLASHSFINLPAQTTAVLATILFFLNGGLGFIYFLEDWRKSKESFAQFYSHLNVNYANMGGQQIQWTNIISDTLLPQRTSLFGIPAALMVFTLFAAVWRGWYAQENRERAGDAKKRGRAQHEAASGEAKAARGKAEAASGEAKAASGEAEAAGGEGKARRRRQFELRAGWEGWRWLVVAGSLTGLLPLFHTHTYMAVGLVSGFLFLLRPRRTWLAFWLPAVLLALPHFLDLTGHVSARGFMRFQPGWRGHNEANWPLYWLRNVGVPLLLIPPAWLAAPRAWRKFYLAFVALFAISLLVVFTPNDYDNIKLMYYWYALTCVLVAAWLVRLSFTHRQRFLAASLSIVSIASGLLALRYEELDYKPFFTREQIEAANFVRQHTAPRTLFLTAPTIHQPVLSLAGRAVLRGDTAWLWSHGYDFPAREADVKRIYGGANDALELLRYYRIDFVYLSDTEKKDLYANEAFFEQNFPAFYKSGPLRIYDTRALQTPATDANAAAASKDNEPANNAAPSNSSATANNSAPFNSSAPSGGATLESYLGHALFSPPPREYAARLSTDPYQLMVEFPRAAFAVYRFYKISYGRMPKYYEFMTDAAITGRGVFVGATGWQEVLEENKRKLTDVWVNRPEFRQAYEGKTNEQFVDTLYANAGVKPSSSERREMINALDRATDTRSSVLRRIAENRQLYKREYNAAYVLMHYFGYLHRNPDDPPDKNLDGFNFWLTDLNKTGDYRSVSRVFIESGEYKDQIKR